ncbi:MAG TPA: DUF3857 domain-containing protein [Candidatus Hydrogenedentes bacterium]|nr:DUF3857 domain-containing protein [Candidatus Hydrogenedentota bacterium]HPG69221.1 DUF3857 domain-containing protein [Candidatus Hydrogenedentota bacterium]
MTRRRLTVFLGVLVVAWGLWASGDTIFYREGEQEPGRLLGMTATDVTFEGAAGVKTVAKVDVTQIQLQRARPFDGIDRADAITDPDLKACLASQPSAEDFPADGSVVLLERQTYDLTEAGVVRDTTRRICKVLRQRGEDMASNNVWYFEDTDSPSIDFALTVTPDGRVLHLSDSALKNESTFAELPDYRRLARFRFACKEPRPGSLLDVQYTVLRKPTDPLEAFYACESFQGSEPILRKAIIVLVREGEEGRVAAHLRGPLVVDSAREVHDGVVRLTWTLRGPQPGIVPEPAMPPAQAFVPMLSLAESTDWEAIGRTYADALASLPPLPPALAEQAIALDSAGGASAIHDFVARNVRTVSVPHLYARMTPHAPEDTLRRGLANELDKNFLYFSLLKAASIPSAFALVRSRNAGPLDDAVPSVRWFDASAVYVASDDVYTTAVSDELPFAVLPGVMHGAPALRIDAGGGLLTLTQSPSPETEVEMTRFDAAVDDDGNLELSVTYEASGNAATWMRGLKDADAQALRNTLEQIAASLHPRARLGEYSTSDLADLGTGPEITVRCSVPGYAVKAGESLMMFDVPTLAYAASDVGRPTREHDLFWNSVARDSTRGAIRLPEGFHVHSMPESVQFESAVVAYVAQVKADEGAVFFEDAYTLRVHEAPASAYGELKACKELRAKLPRQRVILTR